MPTASLMPRSSPLCPAVKYETVSNQKLAKHAGQIYYINFTYCSICISVYAQHAILWYCRSTESPTPLQITVRPIHYQSTVMSPGEEADPTAYLYTSHAREWVVPSYSKLDTHTSVTVTTNLLLYFSPQLTPHSLHYCASKPTQHTANTRHYHQTEGPIPKVNPSLIAYFTLEYTDVWWALCNNCCRPV